MSDHTPTPWIVDPMDPLSVLTGDQVGVVAQTFAGEDGSNEAEAEADAARIVECVNACAGVVNVEALGGVAPMLRSIRDLLLGIERCTTIPSAHLAAAVGLVRASIARALGKEVAT